MKKRTLLLVIGLLLSCWPFAGQAQETETLGYAALRASAQAILDALDGYTLQNEPAQTYDPSGEGAYLYDYGALLLTMTNTQVALESVRQIEIVSDEISGPGGIRVGDTLDTLLEAFRCDNPALTGDESFAAIYAAQLYDAQECPEYDWAWVMRAGETVYGVQYACTVPCADGSYVDAGVLYVLRQGRVLSIRLYGFSDKTSAQEAEMNFATVQEIAGRDTFTPKGELASANALDIVREDEATVDGLYLLGMDEAALIRTLGEAQGVQSTQDEEGKLERTLCYAGMEALLDARGRAIQIRITGEEIEGPRNINVGMTIAQALCSLRIDTGVYSGVNTTLYMEGEAADDPPYAYVDFFEDDRAAIRIGVRIEGETQEAIMVYVDIFQGVVEEIRLYLYTI